MREPGDKGVVKPPVIQMTDKRGRDGKLAPRHMTEDWLRERIEVRYVTLRILHAFCGELQLASCLPACPSAFLV